MGIAGVAKGITERVTSLQVYVGGVPGEQIWWRICFDIEPTCVDEELLYAKIRNEVSTYIAGL